MSQPAPAAPPLGERDGAPRAERASGAPSTRAVELAVALGFAVVGAGMMVSNQAIGVAWGKDGPQAGYFPYRIGALLVLCGGIAALQARGRTRGGPNLPFVERERFGRVLAVFVPTALYVALMQWLGLYLASALLIAYFMRVIGRYRAWVAGLAGLAFAAALFGAFEIEFVMPLPKGPVEAWLGY